MSALALFREPPWTLAFCGVVLLSVIFVFLGRWQYSRHEDRAERSGRVTTNYDAAPVPAAELLPAAGTELPRALDWRPVRMTGRYLPEHTTLVRNRPLDGPGYEVLVPLRLDSGAVVLVDRGWLPAGATGAGPDAVPAPPPGTVEVLARLRPPEPPAERPGPAGQTSRIAPAQLSAVTGLDLAGAYAVLDTETPAPATALTRLRRPDPGMDINLPYAFQWYAFAGAAYVLLGVGAVREVRRRTAVAPAGSPAE